MKRTDEISQAELANIKRNLQEAQEKLHALERHFDSNKVAEVLSTVPE